MTQTTLLPAHGHLPQQTTSWGEPRRAYEDGPALYKVWAATGSVVIQIYGSTQEIADQRWNEFMEMCRDG